MEGPELLIGLTRKMKNRDPQLQVIMVNYLQGRNKQPPLTSPKAMAIALVDFAISATPAS
jgi:hypothetical protein